ncbi:MAG: Na(+)/H(+) antiporter NhaA [Porticoccaceae bacterium]|nr:MAG: Na(+)/H(+) antiporter NhaA [Porticoccaceae bacterium]
MERTAPPSGESPSAVQEFLRSGLAGPVLLLAAAAAAIAAANSPLASWYRLLLDVPVVVRVGEAGIEKPLLLWINDGLMVLFFFLVGLELKREFLVGELAERRNLLLPLSGAVGGMAMPALLYVAFNHDNPLALQGWAIPAATDIAFALGVLRLLGPQVPASVRVFLTSLAIFDDVGAVIIIAIFYAHNVSLLALAVVACCLPVLFVLNRRGVTSKSAYLVVGVIMWAALLKSGVHATLSGVLLAMFIPLRSRRAPAESPLETLEHDLQPVVALFVVPLFAFANAGLDLRGVGLEQVLHPVSLGIAAGLFLGKQIGVFLPCWLLLRSGAVPRPTGMSDLALYGAAILCGIGFTMSLFIGALAFEQTRVGEMFDERLGILAGSLLSGIAGYLVLRRALGRGLAGTA